VGAANADQAATTAVRILHPTSMLRVLRQNRCCSPRDQHRITPAMSSNSAHEETAGPAHKSAVAIATVLHDRHRHTASGGSTVPSNGPAGVPRLRPMPAGRAEHHLQFVQQTASSLPTAHTPTAQKPGAHGGAKHIQQVLALSIPPTAPTSSPGDTSSHLGRPHPLGAPPPSITPRPGASKPQPQRQRCWPAGAFTLTADSRRERPAGRGAPPGNNRRLCSSRPYGRAKLIHPQGEHDESPCRQVTASGTDSASKPPEVANGTACESLQPPGQPSRSRRNLTALPALALSAPHAARSSTSAGSSCCRRSHK